MLQAHEVRTASIAASLQPQQQLPLEATHGAPSARSSAFGQEISSSGPVQQASNFPKQSQPQGRVEYPEKTSSARGIDPQEANEGKEGCFPRWPVLFEESEVEGSASQVFPARSPGAPTKRHSEVTAPPRALPRQVSRSRSGQRRQQPDTAAAVGTLHTQGPSARTPGLASADSEMARPVRGGRGQVFDADMPPGHIHGSHVVYETQRYVFCAICGTYGRYLKRTQLHAVCPRQPRTRWARMAAEDLMRGQEPGGVMTNTPAVPYQTD